MRRILLVLLGFGVFAGYGSAIASARWHGRHHGGGGGCESRWSRGSERPDARTAVAPVAPAAAPAAAPQTILMPQAAPAPAQQIFLIMPGAQAPQVITVPAAAAVPVAAVPAPQAATP